MFGLKDRSCPVSKNAFSILKATSSPRDKKERTKTLSADTSAIQPSNIKTFFFFYYYNMKKNKRYILELSYHHTDTLSSKVQREFRVQGLEFAV